MRTGRPAARAEDRRRSDRERRSKVIGYLVHNVLALSFTLTYDQEHLPADWSSAQADAERFLRLLRDSALAPPGGLAYLLVTGVGKRTARLHHHLALPVWCDPATVQGLWPHGAVELTPPPEEEQEGDNYDPGKHEALKRLGNYLVENIEEADGYRPPDTNSYKAGRRRHPPRTHQRYATEEEAVEAFMQGAVPGTRYQERTGPAWGKVLRRTDPAAVLPYRRGRVGLGTVPPELP